MYLLFWIHMCTLRYYRGWGVTSFRRRPDVLDRYMCFQTIISITTYDICFSYYFLFNTHLFSFNFSHFFRSGIAPDYSVTPRASFRALRFRRVPPGIHFSHTRRTLCDFSIFLFYSHCSITASPSLTLLRRCLVSSQP